MIAQDTQAAAEARPLPIRMRQDLDVHRQQYAGRCYWGVKDPVSLRYFQLQQEEYAILELLDGRRSLTCIREEFERQFAPKRLSIQQLQAFLGMLHRQGLVLSETVGQGEELFERSNRSRRRALLGRFSNVLAIRFRGIDPDPMLRWLAPETRWLFSWWCVVPCLVLMASALTLAAVHFESLQMRLPNFYQFFSPGNLVWLLAAIGFSKILHELAHALACKHFGGECHEMGLMLLAFTPCLYCNVSDSWMLPNKWQRIAISMAGIYVELVLASICLFTWWFSVPGLLNSLCLNMVIVCSISTVVFNGNPLLRYDGYYVLADLVEVPNLRQQSSLLVRSGLARWFLGIDRISPRLLPDRRRGLLVAYHVAATVYRWFVILAILWFCHEFLKPFRLQILVYVLAALVCGSLLVTPVIQSTRFLFDPTRNRQVNWSRFFIRSLALALILSGIVLVPVPYRITVPVALEPEGAKRVYVSLGGTLANSFVQANDPVRAGDPLAQLADLKVAMEIQKLSDQRDRQKLQIENLLRRRISDASAADQLPAVQQRMADIEQRLEQRVEDQKQLLLRAPIDGTVLPPHEKLGQARSGSLEPWSGTPLDEKNVGCYLETGTPYCLIGDPDRLEAVAIIDQADIEFVGTDQRVWILLDQLPQSPLWGTITEVSEIDLEVAPRSLIAHEDLPTETDATGVLRPVSTTYQARVVLDPYTHPLIIGACGRAKIHVAPQSLAHRLKRFLSGTFRFEL